MTAPPSSPDRLRLGVAGAEEHFWPSVDRTRRFYLDALQRRFEVVPLEGDSGAPADLDALLNFAGPLAWHLPEHPPYPLLFGMHGGAVLEPGLLRDRLGALETTDVLLVNCTSDQAVLADRVRGEPPRRTLLPLPVDGETFFPRDRDDCRRVLEAETADLLVGFVARLLPQKGLHYFLELLAAVRRRLAPVRVEGVIVGDYWGDYPVLPYVTETYPGWIAERIGALDLGDALHYFPARLSDDDVARVYGAVDVLVHPTSSLDENFGYVPVEAMACGTPVVGAAYGGLKDTVASGATGYLMPTWTTRGGLRMDRMAGADALEALLRRPALRRRLGKAARQRILSSYDPETCGERLAGAVTEAIRDRRRGPARPVVAEPLAPVPEASGILPEASPPWESYRPAVERYVSQERPAAGPGLRFQQAAPWGRRDEGRIELDDPAWPVRVSLEGAELEILRACREPISWERLQARGLTQGPALERLLDLGLLLAGPVDGDFGASSCA